MHSEFFLNFLDPTSMALIVYGNGTRGAVSSSQGRFHLCLHETRKTRKARLAFQLFSRWLVPYISSIVSFLMSFFSVCGINKIAVLSCLTNALFILGISNYLFIVNGTLLVLFACLFVFLVEYSLDENAQVRDQSEASHVQSFNVVVEPERDQKDAEFLLEHLDKTEENPIQLPFAH